MVSLPIFLPNPPTHPPIQICYLPFCLSLEQYSFLKCKYKIQQANKQNIPFHIEVREERPKEETEPRRRHKNQRLTL